MTITAETAHAELAQGRLVGQREIHALEFIDTGRQDNCEPGASGDLNYRSKARAKRRATRGQCFRARSHSRAHTNFRWIF